jgi:hypothetical protein
VGGIHRPTMVITHHGYLAHQVEVRDAQTSLAGAMLYSRVFVHHDLAPHFILTLSVYRPYYILCDFQAPSKGNLDPDPPR